MNWRPVEVRAEMLFMHNTEVIFPSLTSISSAVSVKMVKIVVCATLGDDICSPGQNQTW
jgi:hypothetical protein